MLHRSLRLTLILLTLITLVAPAPARARAAQPANPAIEIKADQYGLPLSTDPLATQYGKPAVALETGASVKFTATLDQAGAYTLAFDLTSTGASINAPEAALFIDGATPTDAGRLVLPNFYKNTADKFPLDRYGNDALIRQERWLQWTRVDVRDANFGQPYPLQFTLAQGTHNFEFRVDRESILLGSAYLIPYAPYPSYPQYLAANPSPDATNSSIEMEAEFPAYKNDTSIRPISSRSLGVTPYDTYRLRLNALGGEKWQRSGSAVYYTFDAPAPGYYLVTLRSLQDTRNNFTVFRRITVNGAVPFAELNAYPFHSNTQWANVTLGGATPYKIYLHQGANTLGIEATASPYDAPIRKIQKVLIDINNLSLEIKKLTGNQVDQYKEWAISDYIPDIQPRLQAIAQDLRIDLGTLHTLNPGGSSEAILDYRMAIDNIEFLAKEPDKIPNRMNRFSDGAGSAAALLGAALPLLQSQPLALDKITVHSADRLPPEPQISPIVSFEEGAKRFFHSFQRDPYLSIGADPSGPGAGEIEVWVNRPRQYVDLIQTLADENFTPKTGIRVKLSIMPQESKLVLANAAGIEPDVALGVSTNQPYELAIRNALKDLRTFPDFDSFIRIYSPGSLLSYIINDSAYAIPETQDFWVTFYRKDILQSLGLTVPKTWNEVVADLPLLQRYGMNYNTPLSTGAGAKGYLATAPYIFNFGAELYSDDGFSSGLGTEQGIAAIRFMAQSFTIYGMPLTTASFYNDFRYGKTPLGVSNFTDYLKLITAAPELNGLWGIDLYPATVLPDGAGGAPTQNRYATGSAQSCIMFASTRRPDESWQFMKWWMSTETQVDFQEQLLFSYGMEYLWNSANLEAFAQSPMPEEHKKVVLEQWKWLMEPQKLPGSYMEERELSNAWNKIVFDGVNPRVAIDSAVITINREITRKMEEFGYLQNGVKVKQFKVPTIETVRRWQENGSQQ